MNIKFQFTPNFWIIHYLFIEIEPKSVDRNSSLFDEVPQMIEVKKKLNSRVIHWLYVTLKTALKLESSRIINEINFPLQMKQANLWLESDKNDDI